jgi:hypothetical protein
MLIFSVIAQNLFMGVIGETGGRWDRTLAVSTSALQRQHVLSDKSSHARVEKDLHPADAMGQFSCDDVMGQIT